MITAGWFIAAFLILGGLAGVFLPLLPGVPLLMAGLWLIAWLDHFQRVGTAILCLLGLLTLLAWLADYLAAVWAVKKVGASRHALWGAGAGSILGLFAGLAGLLLGPMLGAWLGEKSAGRSWRQAGIAGLAAGTGLIVSTLVKLMLAMLMLGIFAWAWWF